jgi:hypothetical protein
MKKLAFAELSRFSGLVIYMRKEDFHRKITQGD